MNKRTRPKTTSATALVRAERNLLDRLPALAAEILHEVEQADESFRDAVAHAIRAGDLLIEAKSKVGHGEWLPWLNERFPFSVRTAQGYMRLARQREDAQRLAHLGISGCLGELAKREDVAKRIAAAEEKLAQESSRLLGPSERREEQLTLRDLDLSPEASRLVVDWLEAVPLPLADEYAEEWQHDCEYEELIKIERSLRRLQLRRQAAKDGART